jgi:hypothetical protein
MALPKSFIQAWHDWQHLPEIHVPHTEPLVNDIICRLEHIDVYLLGLKAIEGDHSYISEAASDRLTELEAIDSDLEKYPVAASMKEEIRKFIVPTRRLLEEMKGLPSAIGAG